MTTIAADQAANEFKQLLSRIAQGEEFTIVDRGSPVARLVPLNPERKAGQAMTLEELREFRENTHLNVVSAIDRIRELRKGNRLGPDLTIRQMIDEGRRF